MSRPDGNSPCFAPRLNDRVTVNFSVFKQQSTVIKKYGRYKIRSLPNASPSVATPNLRKFALAQCVFIRQYSHKNCCCFAARHPKCFRKHTAVNARGAAERLLNVARMFETLKLPRFFSNVRFQHA